MGGLIIEIRTHYYGSTDIDIHRHCLAIVSSASDDEIMRFAKGVLASDYEKHTDNILGDNLWIEGVSDEYGEKSVENAGSRLTRMSSLAAKIIDAYPDRFKQLDLILYDSMGRSIK